ncbi:MAG: hypothetical protein HW416_716 [Chloroflexi bacterium]|nr:hypothetical protein [Chloroflexota bacterium]
MAYEESCPGQVVHIHQEVDARYEAMAIGVKAQKELRETPMIIFHKLRRVDGTISPWPVVVNAFASRRRNAFAVDGSYDKLGQEMFERRERRIKPVVIKRSEAPVKEVVNVGPDANTSEIPALVHMGWDPGPYIPAGFLTTYDPDTGIDNCALQRGWIYDDHEIRIFPNSHSHNGMNLAKYEKRGDDTKIAYWVGHHPAVYHGCGVKQAYPESHWDTCGGLLGEPLRLVSSETLGDDFLVPADAEFIIEGIVPRGKRKPEGPFGEYTHYFGGQRLNPYMEVTCISHRKDPFWFSILCGTIDDGIGGLRREGAIYAVLKRAVPEVLNVYRSDASPNHLYVSMRKTHDAQPRAAILAVLAAAGGSVKHVFIFDEDVDIFDEQEVLWAIGSRSDWSRDLIVVPNLPAPTLDPTVTGFAMGTGAGLDCTKPAAPAVYEQRSFVPPEVMAKIDLKDWIPGV